jgi:hypothetical protein
MTRQEAKEIVLPKLLMFAAWVDNWTYRGSDQKWYHFWPDNTTFGPFDSWKEAVADCLDKARLFIEPDGGVPLQQWDEH